MAWRQFDWECCGCGEDQTRLVWVGYGEDIPREVPFDCPACSHSMPHRRLLSKPAVYLYDRPYLPIVQGGRFDTAGYRKPPPLPELPNDASMDQARDMFSSQEYKEQKAERFAVMQDNAQKQARMAAAKKNGHDIDLRKTPLPGDPPLEKVARKRRPEKYRGIAKVVKHKARAR